MSERPQIASIAALLGDRSRSDMLSALMDGRALTATELATASEIAPSTASSHLAKLVDAGLVEMTRQGRHRYFRIADYEVASLLESMTALAAHSGRATVRTGPRADAMRQARVCYDHLAGESGVALLARMRARGYVDGHDLAPALTAKGASWIGTLGIDLDALRARRRPLCLACLDWSERKSHLAGAVGAALLERLFARRFVRRAIDSRALILSPMGKLFIERLELR